MYSDPSGNLFGIDDVLLMAIWGGMVGNVITQMGSGNINNLGDMFKSMGVGAISGLAGYGAGSFMAGITNGLGFIDGFINGAAGGLAGGFAGGLGNGLINGQGIGGSLRSAAITGGIGAGISGLFSGIFSGFDALANGGRFFTGKGSSFYNEIEAVNNTLGGDYFKDDKTMQQYVNSKNGWKPGEYGINNISVEKTPPDLNNAMYGRYENGVLYRSSLEGPSPCVEIGGVAAKSQDGLFKLNTTIYMSPHHNLAEFTATLNHEFIHAFHRSLGFAKSFGSQYLNATEHSAYSYTYQFGPSLRTRANGLYGMFKHPTTLNWGWPGYLIPIY